jgi:1,2-diacylglycerol 3-alpha-glucosyltransferase
MNILLFNNNFLPKIDGMVFRIKMFLDIIDKDYKQINVTVLTPNNNTIKKYKRFDIIHLDGELLPDNLGGDFNNEIYTTKINSIYDLQENICNICKERSINVIHVYQGDSSLGGFIYTGNLLDIPIIYSWHTNVFKYLESYGYNDVLISLYKKLYLVMCFSHADYYLTVSESCKKELIDTKLIEKEIDVLPFLIDTKVFYPLPRLNGLNGLNPVFYFTILFVGRLAKEKNIDELIELYKELYKELYNRINQIPVLVIICGHGPYEDELKEKTKDLNFMFIGKVKYEELIIYYNMADVFINPSTTETMGFTTLEAMACKLLVVGRNAMGTCDIIKHNKTGLLYNNLNELTKIILNINKNKHKYNKIIEEAYKYVIQFTLENYTEYLLNIYKLMIKYKKKYNYNHVFKNMSLNIYNIVALLSKLFMSED